MICTAMIQVDSCGWIVCGQTAEQRNRCVEHQATHAVEQLADMDLFSMTMARLRQQVAGEYYETKQLEMAKRMIQILEEEAEALSKDTGETSPVTGLESGIRHAIVLLKERFL